jgi:hypothetical protein
LSTKIDPMVFLIGCKSLFSLVDLIEMDFNLEKEFGEFERAFERDKIVEL